MRRAIWALVVAGAAVGVACYDPNTVDGAFACSADQNFICPSGLSCDPTTMLCVHHLAVDGGAGDSLPAFDFAGVSTARTCEQRVAQGAFSNLRLLLADANATGNLAISPDSHQLYWVDGLAAVMTATTSKTALGTPAAVTLSAPPSQLGGITVTTDGNLWFAGLAASSWSLYQGTLVDATHFTVGAAHQPSSACAFADPNFAGGDAKSELYLSSSLGTTCPSMPGDYSKNLIAQGTADKQMGAFFGAFAGRGYTAPFVLPGGTTMVLTATTGTSDQLFYSTRAGAGTDGQWSSAQPLPMGSIGVGNDHAALVAPDCSTLYLLSTRAQGAGIYAADIAAQ